MLYYAFKYLNRYVLTPLLLGLWFLLYWTLVVLFTRKPIDQFICDHEFKNVSGAVEGTVRCSKCDKLTSKYSEMW